MTDNTNATPAFTDAVPDPRDIASQLISIERLARAKGHYDGADWIKKVAMVKLEQIERGVAEVSEPRKCVQTVNRFGFPLHVCCGDNWHPPYSACDSAAYIYRRTCSHHEPVYEPSDPPSPDASRTDAPRYIPCLMCPDDEDFARSFLRENCGNLHSVLAQRAGKVE